MKVSGKMITKVLVSVIVMTAMGCASQPKKAGYSGFLENYPRFEQGLEGVDKRYLKPGVDFKKYNKVMLDHVVFYFKDDATYKGIQTNELNELAEDFHKSIAEALGGSYPLVDQPGPDVMRIRTAVTNIVPNNPGISAVTTVLPIGLAMSVAKKAAGGGHTGVGEASMEAEFLDSLTNERLAAAIDTQAGGKLRGVQKYGAAKDAFDFWAKRLRAWLDEVHGRK